MIGFQESIEDGATVEVHRWVSRITRIWKGNVMGSDEASLVEFGNRLAEDHSLFDVMSDEDDRRGSVLPDLHELLLQVTPREGIKRPEGFVKQQQFGFQNQGAGDGHALGHPAG